MFVSAVLAASLVIPGGLNPAPLAPGKPAGYQQAQGERRTDIVLFSAIGLVTATGLGILVIGHAGSATSGTSTP
jgi:hypothetical protein